MIHSGLTPRSKTARLAESRLPNQCIFAPVWYRGGMHRKLSVRVWRWWFISHSQASIRALCPWRIAFGKPVVPDEK
jgi:hypothetical protein